MPITDETPVPTDVSATKTPSGDVTVTGTGQPGDTITVTHEGTDDNGDPATLTTTGTVGDDGHFTITVPDDPTTSNDDINPGDTLTVTQTDTDTGLTSDPVDVTVHSDTPAQRMWRLPRIQLAA